MTYKRIDSNQSIIVEGLRAHGCSVQSIAGVGKGCPDLLVGYINQMGIRLNFLMECKDGSKKKSKRKLTFDEIVWAQAWKGQYTIVESLNDALRAVGIVP